MGCKDCSNAICKPKLALVIYNLGFRQFSPVLYDFQGKCFQRIPHTLQFYFMNILGQQINFDFEVEKNAIVGPFSCGAWFDGEYYIIDATVREVYNGIIRNVEFFLFLIS